MMRRSVWFDLPVANLADAMSFYEGLLGWTYRQMEDSPVADYVMIETEGTLIGGLRQTKKVQTQAGRDGPILYFSVEKLTDKIARAKELGAEIVGKPKPQTPNPKPQTPNPRSEISTFSFEI